MTRKANYPTLAPAEKRVLILVTIYNNPDDGSQMSSRLYNSLSQHLLVTSYSWLSSRIDLHSGVLGRLYRFLYLRYKHAFEGRVLRAIKEFVPPQTLVIDVGANIGFFSIYMCKYTEANILAFEPEEQNYSQLLTTIREHRCSGRIMAQKAALSDRTGEETLYLSDLSPADHKLINTRSSRSVPVASYCLDDFLASHGAFQNIPVSLIKIDVQGAELAVLRGMKKTLETHHYPPFLVEYSCEDLEAAGVEPEEFFHEFGALDYRFYDPPSMIEREAHWYIDDMQGAYADILMVHRTKSAK